MRKNQNYLTAKRSFTLIELVVTTAIFGILVVGIGQFLASFLNLKFNAETIQRMRQEGNYALDQIDYLVRNSLTLPDVCVGRVIPKNPPKSDPGDEEPEYSVYANFPLNPADGSKDACDDDSVGIDTGGETGNPLICELDPTPGQAASGGMRQPFSSEFYDTTERCGEQCQTFGELRTNTQGDNPDLYFVRNLVTLATYDSTTNRYDTELPLDQVSDGPSEGLNGGSLYLFRTRDPTQKHLSKQNFAGLVGSSVDVIALTNFRTGTGGDVPFTVSNFRTFCFFDYFTNGYVVNTSFDITYSRRALSGRMPLPPITERFRRSTVVRNPYPFEY